MTNRIARGLLVILCFIQFAKAADPPQRFHAGAFIGGDVPFVFSDAWYLFGGHAGIYSDLRAKRDLAFRVELAYTYNGGYIRPTAYPSWPGPKRASFQYIEVPVLVRWIPKQSKSDLQLSLCGGAAYTRLIDYKLKLKSGLDLTDQVKMPTNQAVVPFVGVCFMNKRIGTEVRFAQPLDLNTGMNCSARINFEI